MTLKKYRAETMAEALAEVKRDLGRDAVILHTRNFRKGGLLGLWGRWVWEVTASPNVNVPKRMDEGKYVSDAPPAAPGPRAKLPAAVEAPAPEPPPAAPPPAADAPGDSGLAHTVADIRRMLETLMSRKDSGPADLPPGLHEYYDHLVGQEVPEALVSELLSGLAQQFSGGQLSDGTLVRAQLRNRLAERICAMDDARPSAGPARVIALIGPTGVGKTTTIAKMAANYKLRKGKTVGLLTIDTYRIAAVDQLRTYGEIIEVPVRAVLTAGELHQAVEAMRGCDVILIDTAGRSPNNRLRLSQLRSFLAAAQPDEVHLVLSATASRATTQGVLERFLPLGANRLIVTKLDEAATFGLLLSTPFAAGKPLSFVTMGQGVPEDILPAEPEALAECILAGRFGEEVHVA